MKRGAWLASLVVLSVSATAFGDDDAPPPLPPPTSAEPAPSEPPPTVTIVRAPPPPATTEPPAEKPGPKPVPDARTGFQMSLRTGVAVPMGKVQSGQNMYDTFSPQAPFEVALGVKVIPHLYLGAYLGIAIGGVNNALADRCDRQNADCGSARFIAGLEAQVHLAPGKKINPWFGYGIGLEGAGVGVTVRDVTTTTAYSGFDFARITGGFDVRISRVIGLGPLVDLTLGRYGHTATKVDRETSVDSSIDNKTVHGWLTIGGRVVFFP